MSKEEFLDFIDGFDFDAAVESYQSGEWMWILNWWPAWVVVAIVLILIGMKNTRDLGTMIAIRGAVGLVYFVGGVILKNSDIASPGPFVIAAVLGFGVTGYFVYTQLFKS